MPIKMKQLNKRYKKYLEKKDRDKGHPQNKAKKNDDLRLELDGDTIEIKKAQGNKTIFSIEKNVDGPVAVSQWSYFKKLLES